VCTPDDDFYGSPNGGGGGRGGRGGRAHASPVTTQYAVECPTGLSTIRTVVTDIPAESADYTDIIPGWTTTVGVCSACEGQPEVTYTLPPGVSPTAPAGETPAPNETPEEQTPAPTDGTPAPTGYEPALPGEETPAPTGETPAPTDGETPAPSETVPAEETPAPTDGETPAPSETAPAEETPAPTDGETPAPSETAPAEETPAPTDETPVPTGYEPVPPGEETPAPTGETPAPTDGETPGPSETAPAEETPAPTGETPAPSETVPAEETPAPTDETPIPTGYEPVPPGEETPAPTGETPAPTDGETPGPSETAPAEETPAPTGETPAPTAGTPTGYVPIVSAPVPTAGEEVVTTVVSCTFTDIGDGGFTTKTVEVTKEIPATASETSLTVSMTESVTLCTVCGAEPTTVTLTVPASGPETAAPPADDTTTTEDVPEATPTDAVPTDATPTDATPTDGVPGTPQTTDYVPVVSAPVPTQGEEVVTTVVSCTFTDVGDEGFTTKTVEVTKEIPATASETSLSVSMTETVILCTKGCGPEPTTVTLTVPAQETPAETTPGPEAPVTSGAPEATPTDATPTDGQSDAPATTDYAPVVSAPVPTEGEEVITTVVSCTFTDIGDDGFTTKTVEVTKEIPATASENTLTVSMTESVTVCTNCGAEPTTVTLTVPAQETPVEDATTTTADAPGATPTDGTPTDGVPDTPATTDYAPVVSAPVPTEGEEVITTVVSCTFTDIGDDGFTTKTVEVTKEIPATASENSLTVSMTESVTVCTNCGAEPTTVTLTVPALETPAEDATTTVEGVPETTAVDVVTSVPAVEVPAPTGGEEVYTTVIQTSYVDICPTGFTTKTVDITKEVPATITSTTLTVIMTESCKFPR